MGPPDPSEVWNCAAELMEGSGQRGDGMAEAALSLLDRLGFVPAADAAPEELRHKAALLRFAGRMSDVFELAAPDAPGLVFVAGITAPSRHREATVGNESISAGGRSTTFGEAFVACVGEAIEQVAQRASADDGRMCCDLATGLVGHSPGSTAAILELLEDRAQASDAVIDWVPAERLLDGAHLMIPADLCLTHRDEAGPGLSTHPGTGCAAGATRERALVAGLFEVIERDAAALWWLAGLPPRAIALETLEAGGVIELVQTLRRGTSSRRSWILDITTDLAIPCVVALSFTPDGRGFVHGVAAGPSLPEAAKKAFLELCQMEVAYHLIAARLAASGESKLSPADRRHQQRFDMLDPDRHALLLPQRGPARHADSDIDATDPTAVVRKLHRQGYDCLAVDLTRQEIGVPVVKVLVPGLQPMPSAVRSARLRQAAECDGNPAPTEIPLF
jgi:ribosomal protein S12 methylthiotransferase accessory factor